MMKFLLISTVLFALGCSVSEIPNNEVTMEERTSSIIGEWKFESQDFLGDPINLPQLESDSIFDLMVFFGAQVISESPGKTIHFFQNGEVETNLVDLDKKGLKINYELKNDSLLNLSFKSEEDSSRLELRTTAIINSKKMTWIERGVIKMELIKIE